jgi:hypothetical protein
MDTNNTALYVYYLLKTRMNFDAHVYVKHPWGSDPVVIAIATETFS